MAFLRPPKEMKEVKKMGLADLRKAYEIVATEYSRMLDGKYLYCHKCNTFYSSDAFYNDKRFKSGVFCICKRCLQSMAMDYDKKTDTYIDNREKTIEVFRILDLKFSDALYNRALQITQEKLGEKNRESAYASVLTSVKSLPQYRNKTFKDSEYDTGKNPDELELSKKTPRKEIKKLFGPGFSNEDYLYLQDQYDDWNARTQVDSKSQQTYIVRICFKLLDIWKAQLKGLDTTKLDESLNKLMDAAKLQPKQNVSNAATDSLTFGQLIERWENDEPIPEPDPELADVDDIGKKIRVWFGGWLAHALGLNVPISKEYEEEVAKYSVETPVETENTGGSKLYKELFGGEADG